MDNKKSLDSLFDDIRTNRTDGASTLAKKTLLSLQNIIPKIQDKELIKEIINTAKSLRPSMPIIRNTVSRLEGLPPEKIPECIDKLIGALELKRKKIVDIGTTIISQFQNIGVVSFSSNINEILLKNQGKNLFALKSDKYALMFGDINFVGEQELEDKIEIGITGTDAIVVSDTKIYIVNGYPSETFIKSIKQKNVFIFGESEKIINQNLYSLEENLQMFEMKENIHLIIV